MAIRVTQQTSASGNGQVLCQAEVAEALKAWRKGGYTAEGRLEIDEKWRACTDYRDDCPVCIAGREEMMRGLSKIASGDFTEGFARVSCSFTSVRYKWSRLMDKFGSS